jgi:monothiol glutaredoxin
LNALVLEMRMTFSPESELSAEEVQTRVDQAIEDNEIVVFMKGNRLMPQCGYSKRAVELVGKYVDEFETVDVLPALPEFRAALESHSGWETTPQTYVEGEFIGGSDILAELDERGELEATLST